MKKCTCCSIDKTLTSFYKRGIAKKTGKVWYSRRCKKCQDHKFRPPTGKKNTGRFENDNAPWNKGLVSNGNFVGCKAHAEWKEKVLKRDCNKCCHCFSDKKLVVHHIKTWKDFPELRFDINNGLTLCRKCHARLHGKEMKNLLKNGTSWNKGRAMRKEHIEILRSSRIGIVPKNAFVLGHEPWNKGIKTRIVPGNSFKKGHVPWNKGLKFKKEIINGNKKCNQ